jgi:hypothetical protein
VNRMRSLMSVLGAAAVLAGCYHATIETGLAPSPTVIDQPWAMGFVAGLVPPSPVQTMQRCPKGVAKVETEHSFLNALVAGFTFSLVTPMHIRVTCALDGTTRAAADGASVVQVGALVTPTTVRDAIVRAADEAVATGHPVYVQY